MCTKSPGRARKAEGGWPLHVHDCCAIVGAETQNENKILAESSSYGIRKKLHIALRIALPPLLGTVEFYPHPVRQLACSAHFDFRGAREARNL
jgi:hypothetical protein